MLQLLSTKLVVEASSATLRGGRFKVLLGTLAPPLSSWQNYGHSVMAFIWQGTLISAISL